MVTVTKGELSVIMGLINYAMARLVLKEPGRVLEPIGLPGMAVIELLDSTNGIELDNPEVIQLCDLLLSNGIISEDARGKISSYIQNTTNPIEDLSMVESPVMYTWAIPWDGSGSALEYLASQFDNTVINPRFPLVMPILRCDTPSLVCKNQFAVREA